MKLNRRNFLKSSSLLLGGLAINGTKIFALSDLGEGINSISDTIGIFNGKGGTIGWYLQDDVIIVIDAQFPDTAKIFMDEFRAKTKNNINYLFNTHHHNDHTLGNFYLNDFAEEIIAHENCPRLQIRSTKGTENETKAVVAKVTFNDELQISLPKEKLTAKYFGIAHTSGDSVIHFENANIAHLGDLVFNNTYPYIDNKGESSVKSWISVLEKVENYFDSNTKFIFGHGDKLDTVVGNLNDVKNAKNYLEALFNFVTKMNSEGKSIDEIASSDTVPNFNHLFAKWDGARKMNLRATAEQIMQ